MRLHHLGVGPQTGARVDLGMEIMIDPFCLLFDWSAEADLPKVAQRIGQALRAMPDETIRAMRSAGLNPNPDALFNLARDWVPQSPEAAAALMHETPRWRRVSPDYEEQLA